VGEGRRGGKAGGGCRVEEKWVGEGGWRVRSVCLVRVVE